MLVESIQKVIRF